MRVNNITIKKDILSNDIYKYAFSVEEVNKLVLQGVPFRDAYKQIGGLIEEGKFEPELDVTHTHEGTIGNLCNDSVKSKMNNLIKSFNFEKVADAIQSLSKY